MDRRRWHYLTRQPGFILRSVVLILLVGLGAAWFVGRSHKPRKDLPVIVKSKPGPKSPFTPQPLPPDDPADGPKDLLDAAASLVGNDFTEAALIDLIRDSRKPQHLPPEVVVLNLRATMAGANFPSERKELFRNAVDSIWLNGPARVDAQAALVNATKTTPPTPRAHELLGECAMAARDYPLALESYLQAAKEPEPGKACAQALILCIRQKIPDRLRALLATPDFSSAWETLEPFDHSEGYLILGDYWNLLIHYLKESWHSIVKAPAKSAVTLLCGIVWFLMLHHLSGTRDYGLSILAVALGMLSPAVTLFCLTLQERIVGLDENGTFVNDLIFYISGVGLREELSKLLLFAPLLWFLRKKSDAVVLLTAGCVGLGFAIEGKYQLLHKPGLHCASEIRDGKFPAHCHDRHERVGIGQMDPLSTILLGTEPDDYHFHGAAAWRL